jgi:hypothetical protein
MTAVLMRARAKPEQAGNIEPAAQGMFAAIWEEQPEGIRYTVYRVGDTFIILLELEDSIDNPLPAIAAVRCFQEQLQGGWLAEPPSMEQLTVVGDYRSF